MTLEAATACCIHYNTWYSFNLYMGPLQTW